MLPDGRDLHQRRVAGGQYSQRSTADISTHAEQPLRKPDDGIDPSIAFTGEDHIWLPDNEGGHDGHVLREFTDGTAEELEDGNDAATPRPRRSARNDSTATTSPTKIRSASLTSCSKVTASTVVADAEAGRNSAARRRAQVFISGLCLGSIGVGRGAPSEAPPLHATVASAGRRRNAGISTRKGPFLEKVEARCHDNHHLDP